MRIKVHIAMALLGLMIGVLNSTATPPIQGQRPTTFPDLPAITDSTLLFTQDSIAHQSYKFNIGKLKTFMGKDVHLDSSYANRSNECILTRQARSGDSSVEFTNTLAGIFHEAGDTGGVYFLCDAVSDFPSIGTQAISIDDNYLVIDSADACPSSLIKGYEFSQDFPVDVNMCQDGYISQIRLKANIRNYYPDFQDGGEPGLAVIALNVNGQNVMPSNPQSFDAPSDIIILLNTVDGHTSSEFIYNLPEPTSITSVRATFMWINHAAFELDGLKVTYKIANCPCYQQFLTTDSLGHMRLDSAILPEPYVLTGANGLTVINNEVVELGGELSHNTDVYGGKHQLRIQGCDPLVFEGYGSGNGDAYSSTRYEQRGDHIDINGYYRYSLDSANQSANIAVSPYAAGLSTHYQNNNNNTSFGSQVSLATDRIYQSVSSDDPANGVNITTSNQMFKDKYEMSSNDTTGYSNHTLSPQSVQFGTYGNSNNFTKYEQTKDDIGIQASDYGQSTITSFKLAPLGVYLRTPNVYNYTAQVGQVLTLKNVSTGEMEFENLNLDVNVVNGIYRDSTDNLIKLGNKLTQNTSIDGDMNTMSFYNNKRFIINQTPFSNEGLDSAVTHIGKTTLVSIADDDSSHGMIIGGFAAGEVPSTVGLTMVGSNSGNGTSNGGTLVQGTHTGYGINTIGLKILGQNVKSFGIWMEGKTDDTTDAYADILVNPVNHKLRIANLNTNNSATQVLAKDPNGFSVWKDVSSMKPYSYTPSGSADTNGAIGDVAYDSNYLYIKTGAGWNRVALSTW